MTVVEPEQLTPVSDSANDTSCVLNVDSGDGPLDNADPDAVPLVSRPVKTPCAEEGDSALGAPCSFCVRHLTFVVCTVFCTFLVLILVMVALLVYFLYPFAQLQWTEFTADYGSVSESGRVVPARVCSWSDSVQAVVDSTGSFLYTTDGGKTAMVFESFFDHIAGYVIPIADPVMNYRLTTLDRLVAKDQPCPDISAGRPAHLPPRKLQTCSKYAIHGTQSFLWLDGQTKEPVQYVTQIGLFSSTAVNFWTFTSGPPSVSDDKYREPPSGEVRITDLTPSSTTRMRRDLGQAINDEKRISVINKEAQGRWRAGHVPSMTGMTLADLHLARMPRSFVVQSPLAQPPAQRSDDAALPESFDARTQWAMCPSIGVVRQQGNCGSCWAFAAAAVLTDRLCIATNGTETVRLSEQYPLDCYDTDNYGCSGGYSDLAWRHFVSDGDVSSECCPYTGTDAQCSPRCRDGSPITRKYYAADLVSPYVASSAAQTALAIQRELMASGPVEASFFVFSDFASYNGGVYRRTPSAAYVGSHAVRLVGWGVDSTGTPYWTAANNWGDTWGEHGFFRIVRGTNECGIEDRVVAGRALREDIVPL